MAFNTEQVRQAIRDFDFDRLFLEELGWDNPPLGLPLEVDDRLYSLDAVAEKSGMVAYVHRAATLPDRSVRERIERQLTKEDTSISSSSPTRPVPARSGNGSGDGTDKRPATVSTISIASRPASFWSRNSSF